MSYEVVFSDGHRMWISNAKDAEGNKLRTTPTDGKIIGYWVDVHPNSCHVNIAEIAYSRRCASMVTGIEKIRDVVGRVYVRPSISKGKIVDTLAQARIRAVNSLVKMRDRYIEAIRLVEEAE